VVRRLHHTLEIIGVRAVARDAVTARRVGGILDDECAGGGAGTGLEAGVLGSTREG